LGWTVASVNDPKLPLGLFVPRLAWVVLLASLLAVFIARVRARAFTRDGVADAAVIFVAAFVLRAVVPWGPLDFAEPERLTGLWDEGYFTLSAWSSFSVAFEPARLLDFPLFAYRWFGPLLGSVTCVLVCVIAKKLGLSRVAAVVSGLVLATWPVHVRFSASGNPALLATLLWLAVLFFTLQAHEREDGFPLPRGEGQGERAHLPRWFVLGALVVLCVHARAEGRFVALPLAVWAWKSRARFIFLGVVALALLPYAVENLVPSGSTASFRTGIAALGNTLLARGVTPDWSLVAGLVGLCWPGLFTKKQRAQFALVFAVIVVTACAFGSEDNPLWGHWRYLMPVLPFVALGVGRVTELLGKNVPRRVGIIGLVFALLPLVVLRGVLLRSVDLQQEFQFVLRSAPSLPRDAKVVLEVPLENDGTNGQVHFELTAAMAARLAGREVLFADVPRPPAAYVLFQGLSRGLASRKAVSGDQLDGVILSQRERVAPLALVLNSQCQHAASNSERPLAPPVFGWSLEECEVEFSWVRLR
ncbi:MAG: glycosyltransferase family 39 protein, partial [Archangium sp.]|nr:glycosyltransferase family 39 protein [Archangium sp.]